MTDRAEIKPLADHVIDQIAAGEVVERPASIVKELIENSLDAGARRITIELDGGGIERITVRDDGTGIPAEQLGRAVLRHYTSKLSRAEELAAIGSLGFRGEALASIAAVCDFRITSRTAGEDRGACLTLQPGETPDAVRPAPHPPGTTIEARRLFATIPARRHFLKRPRTELLHVQQLVRRAAFCYPNVGFRLVHDGRQNLSLPPADEAGAAERRWRTLFGAEFREHSHPVDARADVLRVHGWVGAAGFSRQNADLQYIAVNGRIIRDRNIAHAVRMAYADSIPEGRHAAYALHLVLPPDAVDVNVHPGKTEVRFREPRSVHDFVHQGVARAVADGAQVTGVGEPPAGFVPRGEVAPGIPGSGAPYRPSSLATAPPVRARPVRDGAALAAVVQNRFALVEESGDLRVWDLAAVIRAVVGARLERNERASRPLLIPETLGGVCAGEQLARLREFGVDMHDFGDGRLILRGIPVVVSAVDNAAFGSGLVRGLEAGGSPGDAIAASAASAFRTPPGSQERAEWFAGLHRHVAAFALDPRSFSAVLDVAALETLLQTRAD